MLHKSLILLLFFMTSVLGVRAQTWGFGPKIGTAFSTVNGVEGAQCMPGVVAGAFIDRMIHRKIGLETDLLYAMNGFKVAPETRAELNDQALKIRLGYICMPVVGKFYLIRGLNLQLGAQFGYLILSKEIINDTDRRLKNAINRYDVRFVSGLAYDFDFGLILEGRYQIGLTPIENQTGHITNGSLQIAAGWRF